MKLSNLFLILGIFMMSLEAKAAATAQQTNDGMIEVIKFMTSKKTEVYSIKFYDEHDYDGDLSSIEYEVTYFENNKTCKQVVAVEAWPQITPIDEQSYQEDPQCR